MNWAIYLNGTLIATTKEGQKVVDTLRARRREGAIPYSVSVAIYPDKKEIIINTDSGRVMHPAIIVENGKPKLTQEHIEKLKNKEINWNYLVTHGIIEYLDTEEENNCLIATSEDELTEKHTHLQLDPVELVGIAAAEIPFSQHNINARNLQAAKQAKEAIGLYAANYNLRTDTHAFILHYPQKPLLPIKVLSKMDAARRPEGQNVTIALLPYYGYNTKDAIVINKGAVDRGFSRGAHFKTFTKVENTYPGGQRDRFGIPDENTTGYRGAEAYAHLGPDGIANPETWIGAGELLLAGTAPPRFLEEISEFGIIEEKRKEMALENKLDSEGYVDTVVLSESEDGTTRAQIKIRSPLIPEFGDKFASRHFQKGTVGLLAPEADVPYNKDGIRPDILLNPHAIPSRMTLGQTMEMLTEKTTCLNGKEYDGTVFSEVPIKEIEKTLVAYGFRPDGKETFYNAITGEPMKAKIFAGVAYYRRIEHIVTSHFQARGRGRVQMLTKQPTAGKAFQGGLKFEEMQQHALLGHGAAIALYDRLVLNSDKTDIPVCKDCGILAVDDRLRGKTYCPLCGGNNIGYITVPYAFNLALQEMKAVHIYPKLILGNKV